MSLSSRTGVLSLVLAGLLGLAVPATAQDPAEDTPAETVGSELATATMALSKGNAKAAAEAVLPVLADDARTSEHAAAWSIYGRALHDSGYPYAALAAWAEGLALAPIALLPHYDDILASTEQFEEDAWIGGLVGRDMSVPMSNQVRAHVALLAARHHFAQQSWGTVLGMVSMVPEESPHGLEADVLKGVTLAQQQQYGKALAELLPARERADKGNRDDHYVATLSLNVARTFYASGNFGRAMEYYAKVDRGDPWWPQAHFERAWAHFAVDDMPGALGLLHTHHSPFFEDWYFPEAELVRAQALFLMCKFPDTTKTIDAFQARYTPLLERLTEVIGTMSAADAFEDGRKVQRDQDTTLPEPLMRRLSSDARFADATAAVDAAEAELGRLSKVDWASRAVPLLEARRTERMRIEGERILGFARDARRELDDMLEGIELTRIDLLTFEADLYSRAAQTGEDISFGDKTSRLRKFRKKGKQVWPFEGEYWADELGWYRVDARPDCPDAMRRGE